MCVKTEHAIEVTPNDLTISFVSMSQPAIDMNDGAFERARQCGVLKMIASDYDPFNSSIFQRNQCCKWLMHATSGSHAPGIFQSDVKLSVISIRVV